MALYDRAGTKQKPIVRDGTRFYSHATCPDKETHQKRPTYVNVNSVGHTPLLSPNLDWFSEKTKLNFKKAGLI